MPDTATVQIMCGLNNGLRLSLGVARWGGHPLHLHDREVLLNPGENVIDAAFWNAWLADHQDSPLVESRFVYEI
jgi:hypothetical protein